MERWAVWYSKYLDRTIFYRSGFMFSGRSTQSSLYQQWFKKGQFTYLGRVNRHSNMKNNEVLNSSFSQYCREHGAEVPSAYRQVSPNLVASFKSVSKYDKSQPSIDEDAWAKSGEWTKCHFRCMNGALVSTIDVVLSEMDKSTSCGYPWSLKFHNKRDLLENLGSKMLDDYWDHLLGGEDEIVPIWTCSQKCELRSLEKIQENKIRTFLASPFEHSSSMNRLCLDMNNKFYDHAGERIWSVVGSSKFLGGWHRLYTRLAKCDDDRTKEFENNAFELDESEYDSSIFELALEGQRDIRWSMLREVDRTPDNWTRMRKLYEAVVHSVIVLENGELVQKHTGNPSGSTNTIVDNTMILFRLFCYAWILLCREHNRDISYEDFLSNVEAALCGDDNTFTVSDEVVDWFRPVNISRVWSAIGVTTKTPCDEPRPLKEVSFLSNGFTYDVSSEMWMPVPETDRVLGSLAWGSDIDDVRWHLLRACALRLDSYYNPMCRRTLSEYIEYLSQHYRERMVGEVQRSTGNITMATIDAGWKSDLWVESLYVGKEMAPDQRFERREVMTEVTLAFKLSHIHIDTLTTTEL